MLHRDPFAKNAVAFFRKSRSSRAIANSHLSRLISSSWFVSFPFPGNTPLARLELSSASRFHELRRFGCTPISRATCARLFSPLVARRTASSLNSLLNSRRSLFALRSRSLPIRHLPASHIMQSYLGVHQTG